MASRIITKKGSGAPLASDLVHGELAVDTVNKRLYTENAGGTIIELGTAPSTIDINAGTIDGTVIGGSSAAAGSFTTLTATSANVNGTVTADGLTVDGAVNIQNGIVGTDVAVAIGSSGTPNKQLFYAGGDVAFTEDTGTTAKFFWDASAESLTVGNASALTNTAGFSSTLGVKGFLPSITIEDTGTGTGKYTLGVTSGNLGVWDNTRSAYLLYGNSSGNVGIGTSSPSAKLAVVGTTKVGEGVASNTSKLMVNTASGTAAGIQLFQDGVESWIIQNPASTTALTFANSGSERMRIDSSGNLLVGKTSSSYLTDGFEATSDGLTRTTRNSAPVAVFNRRTNDGDIALFAKDGTTVGSIGTLGGALSIGNNTNSGILFNGTALQPTSGGTSRTDGVNNIGASAYRFNDVYATNALIQTSDANEKQDIEVLSEAEQRVAVAAKGLLRKFRWKDSVAEKGDDARIHFGIIAQDLQDAFTAEGLDAGRYGMFIHSTWTDEETGEERSRMGVRYSELLAFIIAAI